MPLLLPPPVLPVPVRLSSVLRSVIGGVAIVSDEKEQLHRDKEWAALAKRQAAVPRNPFSWEAFAGPAAALTGNKAVKDAKLAHAKLLATISDVFGETVTGDALLSCGQWVFELLQANLHSPATPAVKRELQSKLGTVTDSQHSTLVGLTGSCVLILVACHVFAVGTPANKRLCFA